MARLRDLRLNVGLKCILLAPKPLIIMQSTVPHNLRFYFILFYFII